MPIWLMTVRLVPARLRIHHDFSELCASSETLIRLVYLCQWERLDNGDLQASGGEMPDELLFDACRGIGLLLERSGA